MTREELTRVGKLMSLTRCSTHITHLITCLIAIPAFEENASTRNGYISELEKAVAAMKEECNG